MECVYSEMVLSPKGYARRAILLSEEEPESLELTGADVEGMNDDDRLAAGSVLITPNKNYIAFQEGVFQEKV